MIKLCPQSWSAVEEDRQTVRKIIKTHMMKNKGEHAYHTISVI